MSRARLLSLVRPEAVLPAAIEAGEAVPATTPRGGPWGSLSAPVFPADNCALATALSALAGMDFQDGTRAPGALPIAHARDVAAWYRTRRIT